MASLHVDDALCIHCAACSLDCPLNLIVLEGLETPKFGPGKGQRCLSCGHCTAVCPTGAMEVQGDALHPPREENGPSALTPEQLGGYLRRRRSVRRYWSDAADRGAIERLMDVVRWAPSGSNGQPISWLIVHTPSEAKRLAGLAVDWARAMAKAESPLSKYFDFPAMVRAWESGEDRILRGAPHIVVAHASKGSASAPVDGIIALAHLDAAAPAFGLATCWAGLFHLASLHHPPLIEALALPEGHVPIYSLMLGKPFVSYHRTPKRKALSAVWR